MVLTNDNTIYASLLAILKCEAMRCRYMTKLLMRYGTANHTAHTLARYEINNKALSTNGRQLI